MYSLDYNVGRTTKVNDSAELPFNEWLLESLQPGGCNYEKVNQEKSAKDRNDWILWCDCGEDNLKVKKADGRYAAYCCELSNKEIREYLSSEERNGIYFKRSGQRLSPSKKSRKVVPFKRKPKLLLPPQQELTLPFFSDEFKPVPARKWRSVERKYGKGEYIATDYIYPEDCGITRFDYLKPRGTAKGDRRDFGQWHLEDGKKVWNLDGILLLPYRLEDYHHAQSRTPIIVEGEKCVEFLRQWGVWTITFGGSSWQEPQLTRAAQELKKLGVESVIYLQDDDKAGRKKALDVKRLLQAQGVWVAVPELADIAAAVGVEIQAKDDLQDLIERTFEMLDLQDMENRKSVVQEFLEQTLGQANVVRNLETEAIKKNLEAQAESRDGDGGDDEGDGNEPPNGGGGGGGNGRGGDGEDRIFPDQVAAQIAKEYRGRLYYEDLNQEQWHLYQPRAGTWRKASPTEIFMIARETSRKMRAGFSAPQINQVIKHLSADVWIESFKQKRGLIPFANGTLNTLDGTFREGLKPHDHFTWRLPYDYKSTEGKSRADLIEECRPIWDWLLATVGGTSKDEPIVHVLCAYLGAVVRGMNYMQRFLEIIGPTRSGKGTFIRLATALIGRKNVASTSFHALENKGFEIAKVTEAPLVIIPDASKWAGECNIFKALTGQDVVGTEEKNVQQKAGCDRSARGMFIVAGEQQIGSGDAGGVDERRLSIRFHTTVKQSTRKDLITLNDGEDPTGVFAPYLGAFFNLVLSYSPEEIENYIWRTNESVPRLMEYKIDAILNTDVEAQFLEDFCYWGNEISQSTGLPRLRIQMGNGRAGEEHGTYLYDEYRKFCLGNGSQAKSSPNFWTALSSLMNNKFQLPIIKKRESKGTFIYGLGLRNPDWDNDPPRIVSQLYLTQLRQGLLEALMKEPSEKENGDSFNTPDSNSNAQAVLLNAQPPTSETPSGGADVDNAVLLKVQSQENNSSSIQLEIQSSENSQPRTQKTTALLQVTPPEPLSETTQTARPEHLPTSIEETQTPLTEPHFSFSDVPTSTPTPVPTPVDTLSSYFGGAVVEEESLCESSESEENQVDESASQQKSKLLLAVSHNSEEVSEEMPVDIEGKTFDVGDSVCIKAGAHFENSKVTRIPQGHLPGWAYKKYSQDSGNPWIPVAELEIATDTWKSINRPLFVVAHKPDGRVLTQTNNGIQFIFRESDLYLFKKGDS